MIGITLLFQKHGDPTAWPDLKRDQCIHISEGTTMQACILEEGMESGLPSVALRIDLPTGKSVIVETSAKLFCSIADVIRAKYPTLKHN